MRLFFKKRKKKKYDLKSRVRDRRSLMNRKLFFTKSRTCFDCNIFSKWNETECNSSIKLLNFGFKFEIFVLFLDFWYLKCIFECKRELQKYRKSHFRTEIQNSKEIICTESFLHPISVLLIHF